MMQQNNKTSKVFYLIFGLCYIALLTTFSRSSYLMLLVSGSTYSLIKKSKKLFLLTLFLFGVLMIGFQTYSQIVAKPRNIDREQSAVSRLDTWQQGFTLFQKSPIFGIGFNSYRYGIEKYNLSDENFIESHGSSSNDSSLLFVAATNGALGLLVYLFFLWSLVKNTGTPIVPAAVSGLIIHSVFANSLFYPPILLWLLISAANPKK